MNKSYQNAMYNATISNIVKIPTGFVHRLGDFDIIIKNNQAIIKNKSIDSFRKLLPNPVVKYVDGVNGSDSNSGNSLNTAYKSLSKLITVISSCDRVYFAKGNYAIATASSMFVGDMEIISLGGDVVILRGYIGSQLTWTSLGGGVFSANLTYDPKAVLDSRYKDADGDTYRLSVKTSINEVMNTNGSYWRDSINNLVYVNLLDGTMPTDNFMISITSVPFSGLGTKAYTEGITFLGLTMSNSTASTTYFLSKNCKFIHSYVTNSLNCVGNFNIWLEGCLGAKSMADGFNYHGTGTYHPHIVESNCVGRNNGIGASSGTNNGSTCHESSVILRLNGEYLYNEGPCVADVGNSKSLNICCVAGESTSSIAESKSAYCVATGVGENTVMWLYKCSNVGYLTYGAENRAPLTSTIFIKRTNIINVESGTILTPY